MQHKIFIGLNSNFLKKILLNQIKLQYDIKRSVRRVPPRIPDNKQEIETQNLNSIEIVKKKVDLKLYRSNLPAAARLAIENDPSILKTKGQESIINEKGDIEIKNLKFSFDAETILKDSALTEKDKENQSPIISLKDFDLQEDKNFPKSKISCSGCGAKLHCQDKMTEGFIDSRNFKSFTKKDLLFTVCFRCEFLKTKRKLLNLKTNPFDYNKFILEKICSQPKAHVILLVDLLDIPNSIYHGWSKLVKTQPEDLMNKNIDICIIGNKFDILPNTGHLFEKSIIECLLAHCAEKGIKGNQIKYVDLISAKTGYNVEKVISTFFKLWNDEGDVYLLGMANAGKSVFFNKLLSSDYCRSLASEAIVRATTSFWPGTTLNNLKFPITFMTPKKEKIRKERLASDQERYFDIETIKAEKYERNHNLKDAECFGLVGSSFKQFSVNSNEIDAEIDSTYSIDSSTGHIIEGENFENSAQLEKSRKEKARNVYRPEYYRDKSTWFYDTPGVLGSQEMLRYFSKQELQIVFPMGIIIPRVYWMKPGQSLFVGGLMRIDLLESTNDERVLFSIMASPALPIVNPFKTAEAEDLYNKYYEEGNVLRVPHKHNIREKPLPPLDSKIFEISCIGNYKSTADIVFSCFGWTAVTSRPETKATVRAFTLGGEGLVLRQPSLLPFIVNIRRQWDRKDGSQSFKSIYYKRPKL